MPNQPNHPNHVVVIGAGVTGLATAALLGREGYRVTVLERLDAVGGRAAEETVDGFRFDTGPSWYLMPDAFDTFFAHFGLHTEEVLDLVELNPAYRLFPEHHEPLDVSGDTAPALFESIEPGAGAALEAYLASAADTYDIALERFLYTNFDSLRPFMDRRLAAQLGDLAKFLTVPLERFVARRFTDTRLRQMLTYPAVFLSSHPKRTPSLYHLMSHTDLTQGVRYPMGGFAAVIDALHTLAIDQGAEVRCGADATAILTAGSRATGVQLADGTVIPADAIISCADLHHTETTLLPKAKRTYDESYFAPRDPGLGTVLVMLGVAGELPQLEHHNLLFSEDWEPDFDAVFDGPVPARPDRKSVV